VAPGSYLAFSHITDEAVSPEASQAAQAVYRGASAPVAPARAVCGITCLPVGRNQHFLSAPRLIRSGNAERAEQRARTEVDADEMC
jgi:hypothetical protein